jgi:hypothetical protein
LILLVENVSENKNEFLSFLFSNKFFDGNLHEKGTLKNFFFDSSLEISKIDVFFLGKKRNFILYHN